MIGQGQNALDQFLLASDIVSSSRRCTTLRSPSQLKAWIDRVCGAGKTFRYDERACTLGGREEADIASTRGGVTGLIRHAAGGSSENLTCARCSSSLGSPPSASSGPRAWRWGAARQQQALEAVRSAIGRVWCDRVAFRSSNSMATQSLKVPRTHTFVSPSTPRKSRSSRHERFSASRDPSSTLDDDC